VTEIINNPAIDGAMRIVAELDLSNAQRERDEVRTTLRLFRDRVRAAAIALQAQHTSQSMSQHTLNEFLDHLGLERVELQWLCRASWRGDHLPDATVTALDEDDARDHYLRAIEESDLSFAATCKGTLQDTGNVVFDGVNYVSAVAEEFLDRDDFDINVTAL